MYGSSLTCVTRSPRASMSAPIDALASPLPMELTTPPVMNTNFGRLFDEWGLVEVMAMRIPAPTSRLHWGHLEYRELDREPGAWNSPRTRGTMYGYPIECQRTMRMS